MHKFWLVLRQSVTEFLGDHGMKLSAALSYYTIFSLGPMLIVVISLAGIFFGRDAVEGKIYYQINGFVGNEAALQIQEIIQNIQQSQSGTTGAFIGIILLLIGATSVFSEIQDSINYIWSIRAKPKRGFVKLVLNRILSFSLVVGFGFIMMVSLAIHALVDLLYEHLTHFLSDNLLFFFVGINYCILFLVITLLFAIVFKVLPDATVRWKDAFVGAAFTAVLFLIGKFLIGFYLGASNIGDTYGAAASVIILLVWVYYTSVIMYFGAEFTKVYTLNFGSGIVPDKTAVFIIKQEVKELYFPKVDEKPNEIK
jgi:membrane protein